MRIAWVTLPDTTRVLEIEVAHSGGSEGSLSYQYFKDGRYYDIDRCRFPCDWWGRVEGCTDRTDVPAIEIGQLLSKTI